MSGEYGKGNYGSGLYGFGITGAPTIPTLPAGSVAQLADMQNLQYAAAFALGKPCTRIIDTTGGQAIGTAFAAVNFVSASFDVDGMFNTANKSRLTAQTPGWYKLRYAINVGTVGGVFNTYAQSTTGANNPQGAGINSAPHWMGYADVVAGNFGWAGASGVWPFFLYAGDYLQVFISAAATGASTGTTAPGSTTDGYSYLSLEYVSIT